MTRKQTGADQLNIVRDNYNMRVSRKQYLGAGKGVVWRSARRHRAI